VLHVDDLNAHIESFTRTQPTETLLRVLEGHGVPAAAVRSPAAAVRDPLVLARGETVALEHPQFGRVADVIGMGVPITLSDGGTVDLRPAPSPGQDNDLVYGEWLGYGADGVARMRAGGLI
jgi:crotonobetainyl-CoA:carnitine CoA-transferase CaiB-like acyl-CoA transferase